MIAVVVPAHQEEALIGRCLTSARRAARNPILRGETVAIIVVLDRCTDRTGEVAAGLGARTIALDAGNVGRARRTGADVAIRSGARWLAFTDADSVVPADWLSGQLAHAADAFCGMVRGDDWSSYPLSVARAFARRHAPHDGHTHVYGANLGVRVDAYQACGGFRPLASGEDVALIGDLAARGATIARAAWPIVRTSTRRASRAPHGFSEYLNMLDRELATRQAFTG